MAFSKGQAIQPARQSTCHYDDLADTNAAERPAHSVRPRLLDARTRATDRSGGAQNRGPRVCHRARRRHRSRAQHLPRHPQPRERRAEYPAKRRSSHRHAGCARHCRASIGVAQRRPSRGVWRAHVAGRDADDRLLRPLRRATGRHDTLDDAALAASVARQNARSGRARRASSGVSRSDSGDHRAISSSTTRRRRPNGPRMRES